MMVMVVVVIVMIVAHMGADIGMAVVVIIGMTVMGSSIGMVRKDSRKSMHVPPNRDAVRDAMPTLFELPINEEHPGVRVMLGHFIFGKLDVPKGTKITNAG